MTTDNQASHHPKEMPTEQPLNVTELLTLGIFKRAAHGGNPRTGEGFLRELQLTVNSDFSISLCNLDEPTFPASTLSAWRSNNQATSFSFIGLMAGGLDYGLIQEEHDRIRMQRECYELELSQLQTAKDQVLKAKIELSEAL